LKILKNIIKRIFAFFGYKIIKITDILFNHPKGEIKLDFRQIVTPVILDNDNFFFVQIGSNDGISNDYLYKLIKNYHLRGILIEPQKDIFEILKENYSNEDQLIFENIAITTHDGYADLFRLKDNYSHLIGEWANQISSLYRTHIEKQILWESNSDEIFESYKIPCLRLNSLYKKHGVEKVDLLQIDTEGHDYEIIKTIDFQSLKPTIICYEHIHLSPKERESCWNLLRDQGYIMWTHRMDTIARLK